MLNLNIKCFITLLRPTKPQIKKTVKLLGATRAALSSEGRQEKLLPLLQQESNDVSAATLQSATQIKHVKLHAVHWKFSELAGTPGFLAEPQFCRCWITFVVFCDVTSLPSTWVESEMFTWWRHAEQEQNKKKITPQKSQPPQKDASNYDSKSDSDLNLYPFLNYSNPI